MLSSTTRASQARASAVASAITASVAGEKSTGARIVFMGWWVDGTLHPGEATRYAMFGIFVAWFVAMPTGRSSSALISGFLSTDPARPKHHHEIGRRQRELSVTNSGRCIVFESLDP